jgi:hypothetical protein
MNGTATGQLMSSITYTAFHFIYDDSVQPIDVVEVVVGLLRISNVNQWISYQAGFPIRPADIAIGYRGGFVW